MFDKCIHMISVKCPKGKKAVIEKDGDDLVSLTCVECDEGQYTGRKGLFESCCACPEGESTLPGGNTGECFGKFSVFIYFKTLFLWQSPALNVC